MHSKIFLVFVVFFGACVATDTVNWSDCGSTAGEVKSVVVANCPGDRCILKRGTNATLAITFISKVSSTNLTAVVYGDVLGYKTKFPLPNADACKGVGVECPLEEGKTYVYTDTFEVKQVYPRVIVEIWWELITDTGDKAVCIIIPAKIN
ncbi:unnamed protein product [Diabrotica balteata]|uniref:MD-2-related lipid-recognition domain-containing protein n=1 Tax=Diabrotica balteata TaxID=107213 RepID=A0A9N9T5K5_DIABA|nr:unnamed protein product [Diabrotica balteata]